MISSSVLLLEFLFAACTKASKGIATARNVTTRNRFIRSLSYVSGCFNQAFFHCCIQNSNVRLYERHTKMWSERKARRYGTGSGSDRVLTEQASHKTTRSLPLP